MSFAADLLQVVLLVVAFINVSPEAGTDEGGEFATGQLGRQLMMDASLLDTTFHHTVDALIEGIIQVGIPLL